MKELASPHARGEEPEESWFLEELHEEPEEPEHPEEPEEAEEPGGNQPWVASVGVPTGGLKPKISILTLGSMFLRILDSEIQIM